MASLARLLDFFPASPKIDSWQEARLAAWRHLPPVDLALPHARARYVVVDTETTGLDLRRDSLIAIGAAALTGGWLPLSDCFETVLRQDRPSADENILIHGIGGQSQLGGVEPQTALLDFLGYLGKSPLVAFRAEFDRPMIERGLRSLLGLRFRHPWIDLAFLLPALFRNTGCHSLEDWMVHFDLTAGQRHHALADAFASAQLLQIALAAAEHQGMISARELIAMQKAQRWLGKRD